MKWTQSTTFFLDNRYVFVHSVIQFFFETSKQILTQTL